MGLRYTQFHTTSLCSPTRAALITGRNHHSVGFGVIGEAATGYPGYNSVITKDKATIGQILKANGFATSWYGKNHNTPPLWQVRPVHSTNGPWVWALNIFTASTAVRPISGNPISIYHAHLSLRRQAELQPHHRHGG
jgi:arylsulfatase A-like enzyme